MKKWKVFVRQAYEGDCANDFAEHHISAEFLRIEGGALIFTDENHHMTDAYGPGYWQYAEPLREEPAPEPKKRRKRKR